MKITTPKVKALFKIPASSPSYCIDEQSNQWISNGKIAFIWGDIPLANLGEEGASQLFGCSVSNMHPDTMRQVIPRDATMKLHATRWVMDGWESRYGQERCYIGQQAGCVVVGLFDVRYLAYAPNVNALECPDVLYCKPLASGEHVLNAPAVNAENLDDVTYVVMPMQLPKEDTTTLPALVSLLNTKHAKL